MCAYHRVVSILINDSSENYSLIGRLAGIYSSANLER